MVEFNRTCPILSNNRQDRPGGYVITEDIEDIEIEEVEIEEVGEDWLDKEFAVSNRRPSLDYYDTGGDDE